MSPANPSESSWIDTFFWGDSGVRFCLRCKDWQVFKDQEKEQATRWLFSLCLYCGGWHQIRQEGPILGYLAYEPDPDKDPAD